MRHEKSVNAALADKEIDMSLFPGYLFINPSPENRLKVLNTRGVIRILCVNGSPTPVPNEQIESIKRLLETNLYFDPFPYFTEGIEVVVVNGPLEGMKGKIIERRGECRLIMSVYLIKCSISVEVDITDVELNQ